MHAGHERLGPLCHWFPADAHELAASRRPHDESAGSGPEILSARFRCRHTLDHGSIKDLLDHGLVEVSRDKLGLGLHEADQKKIWS
jgi:hypothetical protein